MDTFDFILDKPNKWKHKGKPRRMPLHVIMAMNKVHKDENGTPTEPSFCCSICGVLYRPDVLKFYKEHSLGPDIEVCSFCFWAHDLGRPVPPHPNTARYASPGPRATELNQQLGVVRAVLGAEALKDAYLEEVEQVSHGHAYVEKFFDRRGRFNQAALVEDFNMFAAFA